MLTFPGRIWWRLLLIETLWAILTVLQVNADDQAARLEMRMDQELFRSAAIALVMPWTGGLACASYWACALACPLELVSLFC
jgi:hypothetical protein